MAAIGSGMEQGSPAFFFAVNNPAGEYRFLTSRRRIPSVCFHGISLLYQALQWFAHHSLWDWLLGKGNRKWDGYDRKKYFRLNEQKEASVARAKWVRGRVIRQRLDCADFVVLVNEFRFYANGNRKSLVFIVKLVGHILLLRHLTVSCIISMVKCFSIYKHLGLEIKLFF